MVVSSLEFDGSNCRHRELHQLNRAVLVKLTVAAATEELPFIPSGVVMVVVGSCHILRRSA
jgi:hypothetical protein